MRTTHAGQEGARPRPDAEGILPDAIAEAAIEEAIEVTEVDAVEHVERPQRISAGGAGFAQHTACAAQRRQLLGVSEESLARILQDRVELRVVRQDAFGVVV